ncbi:MAG: hypothetical protein Q3M24_15470 [Candidatus Electrothrix aestuarii]|uniref:Lipoprotein n=1 Tax=Candidatus Electrothrix aestuarii TaxID=3062594 RepID=A0AAU8LQD9_9BACT
MKAPHLSEALIFTKKYISIICILAMFMISCGHNSSANYTLVSEYQFDNIKIKIGLIHNHPYLAEYRKFIEISSQETLIAKEELFPDSGGYAWVAIYKDDKNNIIVQDFGNYGLLIDVHELIVKKIENTRRTSRQYIGCFDFDRTNGKKRYRFISSIEDPTEPLSRVKGG